MLDVKSQDISIPDTVVVLCTAPDEATAQDLAAKVLAEKLLRLCGADTEAVLAAEQPHQETAE